MVKTVAWVLRHCRATAVPVEEVVKLRPSRTPRLTPPLMATPTLCKKSKLQLWLVLLSILTLLDRRRSSRLKPAALPKAAAAPAKRGWACLIYSLKNFLTRLSLQEEENRRRCGATPR